MQRYTWIDAAAPVFSSDGGGGMGCLAGLPRYDKKPTATDLWLRSSAFVCSSTPHLNRSHDGAQVCPQVWRHRFPSSSVDLYPAAVAP